MDLPAGVWYVKAEGLMRGSAPCLGCDPYGKSAPTVFGPVMVKSRDGAFSTSTLNPENSTSLQSPQTLKPSHVVQACPKGRRDPILVVCASCSTHTKSLSCSASLLALDATAAFLLMLQFLLLYCQLHPHSCYNCGP